MTDQKREHPESSGIFENKKKGVSPKLSNTPSPEDLPTDIAIPSDNKKEPFLDPFEAQRQEVSNREQSQRKPVSQIISDSGNSLAEKTASALNNQNNVQADLDDLDKIDLKDLELAEQMIFNSYAEFDVKMPNIKNTTFTICSTNAEEMSIIDEVIYDMVKANEDKEGNVDIPQNHVTAMRNALFIAISYRGSNQKELMEDIGCHLNTIKKAVIKTTDYYNSGEMGKADKMKELLKKSLNKRASAVKRLPTPVIDFLSNAKYEFDDRMARIMNSKKILPKS